MNVPSGGKRPGSGRKRKDIKSKFRTDKCHIHVLVSDEILRKFKEIQNVYGVSAKQLVVKMIKEEYIRMK